MFLSTALLTCLLGSLTASPMAEFRDSSNCPSDDWIDASFIGMGCLLFESYRAYDWDAANTYCQTHKDGLLLEIKTEIELQYLISQLEFLDDHEAPRKWWTAGTDAGRNGVWKFAASHMDVPAFVWGTNQPDGHRGDNCMALNFATGYMGANYKCGTGDSIYPICQVVPQDCSASDAIHGSIGFAIDNTGSVSSSSTGIMSLSNGVVEEVITRSYIIPQWVLTTFNDISEEVVDNVELRVTTDDVEVFKTSLNSISFSGGGDGPERATQGLLVTLQTMPRHGVVVLFTDDLTKNLELETDLLALRDEKEIKIFIILAPQYNGQVGDLSWELYKRLSEGRIYNVVDFNKTLVVDEVVQVVGEDCEGSRLPISGGRATF